MTSSTVIHCHSNFYNYINWLGETRKGFGRSD
jgi:hypothetical protein